MIRIFISHSSKDLALTRAVYDELSAANAAGAPYGSAVPLDLLLDNARLPDGSLWPKQLHEWLAKSHAGLILLTGHALASDWVLKEATILTWRQSLERDFKVFIASDAATLTDEALKTNRYGPLSIPSIQRIESLDAATIVGRVRAGLGPTPPVTLFERLVSDLTDLMIGTVKPNTLKVLAERIRVEPPAWQPGRDEAEQYVEEIARRLLGESLGGFTGVNDVIRELLKTVQVEPLTDILNFLAPYWVDAEVAGRLRALSVRQPSGAAALNATLPFHSGLMYIRRAHQMNYDYMLPDIAGGDPGQTAADISDQICRWYRGRGHGKSTDDDAAVKRAIAQWAEPVYVILPERVDPDVLAELRDGFKRVVFVMPTGERLEPDDRFADVDWLQPALESAIEQREHTNFNAAVEMINNKRGRR
jgi:hypothetical protein